jgi:predicted  nucleic acid-binding Zn-ribbon protein
MSYFSKFYQVDVRESIAKEFTNSRGEVDDMMAGLHEIRVRMAEKEYNLKELETKVERTKPELHLTRKAIGKPPKD